MRDLSPRFVRRRIREGGESKLVSTYLQASVFIVADWIVIAVLFSNVARTTGNTWNDYTKIYSEDEYMKEMDDDARVWRVFNDESERIDFEMVNGWIGTLDMLFIFAGLFSAVVATFITLTAQSLQQDYSAVVASLLTEMVALQRATAIGGDIGSVPHSALTYNSTFTSAPRDVRLNGLWLTSLVLTLVTALMAGLIKQWLHYYLADVTGASPKNRACIRQYRYIGLTRWGVSAIIEILPVLMNVSLLLFFLGLILFTQDLSGMIGITWFLVGLTCICFVIYLGSSVLPVWDPQCPYKTSLSKLYFGSLQLFEDTILQLSVRRHRENRICNYAYSKLCHIAELLGSRLSPRRAELQAVEDQAITLQQNVITEMGINSTNPTVSDIAFQSMAALHAVRQSERSLSGFLIARLHGRFCDCFQYDPTNEYSFRVTSPPPVVERYTRALFLDASWAFNWNQILSFSTPITDLSEAVFCTYAVNHRMMPMESLKLIIQCILDLPPIEVNRVYPSFRHQFLKAIHAAALLDLHFTDEQERLFIALMKRLSPQKSLTLQEDLLIHCLYYSCIKAGIIEPLKEEALTVELDSEASADIMRRVTLFRFIRLLPGIVNCTLLLGSEEQSQLSLYLSTMDLRAQNNMIAMKWNERYTRFFKNQPEYSSCVFSLIELLNQLASSWEEWSGSVSVRLRAVTNLYDILWFHGKCNEEVTCAMLHWFLVISLGSWNSSGNTEYVDRAEIEDRLSSSLFSMPSSSMNNLIDPLRTCCAFIAAKRLAGLPLLVMERLLDRFTHLLEESCEMVVLDLLDSLFCHFIEQDPFRVDSVYPMTRADQQRTLTSLISFIHNEQFHSNYWEKMLAGWRVLVIDKLLEAPKNWEDNFTGNENSDTNPDILDSNDNPMLLIDPWDIRDVEWIFEVDSFIDPWDIQDVLWIFEEQVPFGGPLNLRKLLRHLDRALGQREDSIDLRDATWLFRDASNDPFPSPSLTSETGSFEPNVDSDGESQPTNSRKLCRFM